MAGTASYKIQLSEECHFVLLNELEEVTNVPWPSFHCSAGTNLSFYFAQCRFHPCNNERKRLSESYFCMMLLL